MNCVFGVPQMRVLTLQISELERSIHTSRASMPDLPGIDRDIAILKADLLRVRLQTTACSLTVQNTCAAECLLAGNSA